MTDIGPQTFESNNTPAENSAGVAAFPDPFSPSPARPDPLEGGGFTRTTDPINPQEDPRFKEFLRRQGASNASARAAIAKRLAELDKTKTRREEDFGRGLEDLRIGEERGLRDVRGAFESRGLFGSGRQGRGERELSFDVARQREGAQINQDRFLADLAEQVAEVEARRGRIGSGQGAARNRLAEQIRREIILDRARQRIVTDFNPS
jgi:hypothetical protein